jgi:hypothetical protein
LKAYLASQPFPHFEAYSENPLQLVRIDEDGTRTVGNFVERQFIPYEPDALKIEQDQGRDKLLFTYSSLRYHRCGVTLCVPRKLV